MTSVSAFLAHCEARNYAPNTIRQYRSILGRLEHDIGDPAAAPVEDLVGWLALHRDAAPETRRQMRSTISSFFTWAVEVAEIVDRSPMRKIPPVKVPDGAPQPIASADLAAVIGAAPSPRMRAWLLLGCDAGLRRAEIAGLRAEDVHGRSLVLVGKGGKLRTVPMSTRLAEAIAVVRTTERGRLWDVTPDWVGRKVAEHLRACGVDTTTHKLRHSFACRVYQASGGDLLKTARLLGHSNPATTARYAIDNGDDGLMDRLDAS